MYSAAHYARLVNNYFFGNTKGDNFISHPYSEARKVVAYAVRPFPVDVVKAGIFASCSSVALDRFKFSTNGSVDSILGNDDATFKS